MKCSRLKPGEVNAAGQLSTPLIATIPFIRVTSGRIVLINQYRYFLSKDVVYIKAHGGRLWQGKAKDRIWIEWIGIILAKFESVGYKSVHLITASGNYFIATDGLEEQQARQRIVTGTGSKGHVNSLSRFEIHVLTVSFVNEGGNVAIC